MGPGRYRSQDPWICRQTRICCQTRYRLRYVVRYTYLQENKKIQLQPEIQDQFNSLQAGLFCLVFSSRSIHLFFSAKKLFLVISSEYQRALI